MMMFSNWFRPRRRRHQISPESPPKWSSRYSCSSFKDIQHLLHNDDVSSSPSPQVLHQPRCTTRTLPPNTDQTGVVLYYTSLRIVRKTFEECRTVRGILHRLRIPLDERDLTIDSTFHDEMHDIFGTKNVELPRVFIGGRYIGGAEEIKKLNESGELRKMVGEAPPPLDGRVGEKCGMCGGWRFVVCERCNGSHKIFSEKCGFVSCNVCNVQGLVRCSSCFPVHRRGNSDVSGGPKIKGFDN